EGEGEGEGTVLPVAVCDVSPSLVVPPFGTATWDGSASYDPEGHSIETYSWVLVSSPTGSVVRLSSEMGPARSGFMPDIVGDYTAELVVTTDDGRTSAPCQTALESATDQELWVEMFWTVSGDDMDLHVLAPGGSLESATTDCYFATCTSGMSWGTSSLLDDPHLVLDDIPGTGPEVTNIQTPDAGVFTVYVHDYPGSPYSGENSVTVRVYIENDLQYEGTKTVAGEDSYTAFASIDWSNSGSAAVSPL
ncbi:MAG TPA: hypothetical protein DFR83_18595, partial [Deltaproteobacteria bacterium]|nr:hypothetical protein [Deltaproteobacteria bacterium]